MNVQCPSCQIRLSIDYETLKIKGALFKCPKCRAVFRRQSREKMNSLEPKIVGFLCNGCSYEGADSAGRARNVYPANVRVVRVMCSGRIDPQFVVEAFKEGAAGVLILGCHLGDCHYKGGNYQMLRRYTLLRKMLTQFGIEKDRLRLDWVSASEGDKFAKVVSEMVEKVRQMRPLPRWRQSI